MAASMDQKAQLSAYDILGVKPTDDCAAIRKAWRALVREYHPDLFRGDKAAANAKLAQLNAAYDVVISDVTDRISWRDALADRQARASRQEEALRKAERTRKAQEAHRAKGAEQAEAPRDVDETRRKTTGPCLPVARKARQSRRLTDADRRAAQLAVAKYETVREFLSRTAPNKRAIYA